MMSAKYILFEFLRKTRHELVTKYLNEPQKLISEFVKLSKFILLIMRHYIIDEVMRRTLRIKSSIVAMFYSNQCVYYCFACKFFFKR